MPIYQARIEQDEDGRWSSWIDELPGCAAWGYTRDEALSAIGEATAAYIEDMVEAGEIARPDSVVVVAEAIVAA